MGMRLFLPYTFVHRPTWENLADTGIPVTPWKTGYIHQKPSYLDYFEERWAEGLAFTQIEHDIIATREQILEMMDCPEPWCACGTEPGGAALQMAKFSAEHIADTKDVWRVLREEWTVNRFVFPHGSAGHGTRYDGRQPLWEIIDTFHYFWCDLNGIHPHSHSPITNCRPWGEHWDAKGYSNLQR